MNLEEKKQKGNWLLVSTHYHAAIQLIMNYCESFHMIADIKAIMQPLKTHGATK